MKFKKKNKRRLPRKIKKQIPLGLYCYTGIKFDMSTGIYHIKPCIFYTHIKIKDKPKLEEWDKDCLEETIGWCKLLKCEPTDQCKDCSIKLGI